jgi:hypothetical protein
MAKAPYVTQTPVGTTTTNTTVTDTTVDSTAVDTTVDTTTTDTTVTDTTVDTTTTDTTVTDTTVVQDTSTVNTVVNELTPAEVAAATAAVNEQTINDTIALNSSSSVVLNEPELRVNITNDRYVDTTTSNSFKSLIDALELTGTDNQKAVIHGLKEYVSMMMPGIPVSAKKGLTNQKALWSLIMTVINNYEEDFRQNFNLILAFVNEYRTTVFHENYIYRFTEELPMNENFNIMILRLIHILLETHEVQNRREKFNTMSIDRSLATGLSDAARSKLLNFYSL